MLHAPPYQFVSIFCLPFFVQNCDDNKIDNNDNNIDNNNDYNNKFAATIIHMIKNSCTLKT